MATTKPVYYTVAETIIGTLRGAEVEYHIGEVVEADDPGVKQWPACFKPLVVRALPGKVEQATAAPGEKRG